MSFMRKFQEMQQLNQQQQIPQQLQSLTQTLDGRKSTYAIFSLSFSLSLL